MTDLPEPWERQNGETGRQFEAFVAYRDAPLNGRRRVVTQVARDLDLGENRVAAWAKRNGWIDRAAMWDDEQDRIWRTSILRERHRVAQRHARLALSLQAKAIEALQLLRPQDMSPGEIVAMIRQARDLELGVYGRLIEPEDELGAVSGTTIVIPADLMPPTIDPHRNGGSTNGDSGLRALG